MGGIRALSLIRIPESGGSGSGVSSFNTRTGAVTLQSADVTTALGWTPDHIFNVKDYGAKGDGVTDDTVSIQNTINAATVAGGGIVWLPSGQYIIGGPLQTNVAGFNYNSQLYIPVGGTSLSTAITIVIKGEAKSSPGNLTTSVFSTSQLGTSGTWLISTYTGTGSLVTRGSAVIGGAPQPSIGFSLNCLYVEDLNIIVQDNPNGHGPEIGGINARYNIGLDVINVNIVTTGLGFGRSTTIDRNISGIETCDNNGGAQYNLINVAVNGFLYGYVFGEHVSGTAISAFQCVNGISWKVGNHSSTIGRFCAQWCMNGMTGIDPNGEHGGVRFNIEGMDVEWGIGNPSGTPWNTSYLVYDPYSCLIGDIAYAITEQGVGPNDGLFTVYGSANLQFHKFSTDYFQSLDQVLGVGNTSTKQVLLTGHPTNTFNIQIGTILFQSYSSDNNHFGSNTFFNGSTYQYQENGGGSQLIFNESGLVYKQFPTGGTGGTNAGGGTQPFVIQNDGTIGLGGQIPDLVSVQANATLAVGASNVSIGYTSVPTARLQIGAGTAIAGTAPLKLTSGILLTIPETGAFEFDGTNLYFTVGGTRKTVTLT